MKIKIINNISYQTFPIDETAIEIDEEILHRIGIDKQFVNGRIVDYVKPVTIEQLKQNLADTDYQAIKFAEGRMTAEEYAPIGEQRQAWRDEINRLEQ